MHQQQWVGCAQPQRTDLGDPAALRQSRRRPDDQSHPDQHHDAMTEHCGDDVLPGQGGDPAADPEEQRPVGCRRFPPEARHREGEHVIQAQSGRGSDVVGVQSVAGDLALRQVGVDVLAVHRRSDQQRQHPQQQGAVQLAARHPARAQREAAEHQPGQGHHHRSGGGHRQRDRLNPGGEVQQAHSEGGVLHHRPGTRPQSPDAHQHRSGRTEQPGSAHADELGPGQRRRLDVLVAVQPRNRRTQGELPGCHHYRTLSAVGRRPD